MVKWMKSRLSERTSLDGLAIIVIYYRNSGTIKVQEIDKLKG